MKILDQPDYTAWTHEFTCLTCATKLEADHTDLQYRLEKQWYQNDIWDDFGRGYYANKDYYYVVCPVCDQEKHLIHNQAGVGIPYLLQKQVKEDYKRAQGKTST